MVVAIILIGCFIGSVITSFIYSIKTSYGTLRIDHSNPEKDVYRFDVDDIDELSNKKRIVLKVDNNAIISHK